MGNIGNSPASGSPPENSEGRLTPRERAVVWEVNIARQCLERFNKIVDAHAIVFSLLLTVSLIGFLQPPRGWQTSADEDQNATMYNQSLSVDAFSICNSVSLFSAISGLLLCVYCSYATILSLSTVPLPERFDELGIKFIHKLRSALRGVALPSVRRRSLLLFSFLLSSISFSVATYVSAGLAATAPPKRFVCVILPSIPGCAIVLLLLCVSAAKISLELNFESRFELLWRMMDQAQLPYDSLPLPVVEVLDPMPTFVRHCVNAVFPNHYTQRSKVA